MPLLTKLKYKEYKKNYNAINKVMLNEKAREYYNNNSEEIKWKINVKVSCECGGGNIKIKPTTTSTN